MDRNRWPSCFGMGGHLGSESLATMHRNMQSGAGIAKMDELKGKTLIPSGRYRLVPFCNLGIAKMEELIVELGVISRGCGVEV